MSERKVAVEPADLARQWPLSAKEQVHQELKRALEGCRRKMVVLDDDPTGVHREESGLGGQRGGAALCPNQPGRLHAAGPLSLGNGDIAADPGERAGDLL